ncbi:MAG TPA: ATP-binding protein [Rhizomicrobium sp.]|nr:ATP-binding protein [Rhizomicrobium sp.]
MSYEDQQQFQPSADGRVVKAQVDFIASVVHATRFTAPLWSLAIAFMASSGFNHLGRTPFWKCALFPVVLASAFFAAEMMVRSYERVTEADDRPEIVQAWFFRFMMLQIAISTAWGTMPWLLWDHGNAINQIFLGAAVVAVVAGVVVSRANHVDMFLASLVPIITMASLRFAFGGSALDVGIAVLLPLCGVQLFLDGRRLTRRLDEDSRLRFQVEDLARELEETRDEALRKRFEAETANASKTAFLANMSHELRTPLNAILGFSEIIAQECFGPAGSPRYKEYAVDIHSSGAHLLSLINDLLDVAKIEAGKMDIEPDALDVRRTFDTVLKIMDTKSREKHQELVIDIDISTPPLYADERALRQILINLVSNAVKFTPEHGRVAVVTSQARDGGFQILVEDNGPGIPREKLDRIFTPFSQVDNRYDRQAGGTGLGLALVRGLAELHGGRAWLESEYGKGCRAYVVLPAAPDDMQEPVEPPINEIALARKAAAA